MVPLLTDENISIATVQALRKQEPSLDVVRLYDISLLGATDPEILKWCAEQGRVLLTHDQNTMPKFAYQRLEAQKPMPGVLVVRERTEDRG